MRFYAASSWRNPTHPAVVAALRAEGHEVYDFRHPEGEESHGFHWRDCYQADDLERDETGNAVASTADAYLAAIEHPLALAGFGADFGAMHSCDACVLVLPSGRSSHLEAGWFVGQHQPVAVLLTDPLLPELMYRMFSLLTPRLAEVVAWADALRSQEERAHRGRVENEFNLHG